MFAKAREGASAANEPQLQPPRGGLSLSSLVAAGLVLDLMVITLASWALARANGIALWPVEEPVSALCFALPFLVVFGAWTAQGFSFRHALSFRSHLVRTGAGGLTPILFALALYIGVAGGMAPGVGFIAGAALVLICALHANYLGIVRSLARAGILARPLQPIGS